MAYQNFDMRKGRERRSQAGRAEVGQQAHGKGEVDAPQYAVKSKVLHSGICVGPCENKLMNKSLLSGGLLKKTLMIQINKKICIYTYLNLNKPRSKCRKRKNTTFIIPWCTSSKLDV